MKKVYMRPSIETVLMDEAPLMEKWSIEIDNDPDHGIGPGDEDDIGAKPGFLDHLFGEERQVRNRSVWDED